MLQNPVWRALMALTAVVVLMVAIYLQIPEEGAASVSLCPQLNAQQLAIQQRDNPEQALMSLSGRCVGDWRHLPEPARHVWITLRHETIGLQAEDLTGPNSDEITAAYVAMGIGGPARTTAARKILIDARERYIHEHASAFDP